MLVESPGIYDVTLIIFYILIKSCKFHMRILQHSLLSLQKNAGVQLRVLPHALPRDEQPEPRLVSRQGAISPEQACGLMTQCRSVERREHAEVAARSG